MIFGRFRWVACQIDYLCELPNDRERRKALESLPPDLNSTYERILERLNGRIASVRRIVRRTLKWLIYSEVSLTSSELRQAISVNFGDEDLDFESIPEEEEVLRCCSSLIRLSTFGYELAHFTVKEFFAGLDIRRCPEFSVYHMEEEGSTLDLAGICLTYLNFEVFGQGPSRTLDEWELLNQKYRFKDHCVNYWKTYWNSRWSDDLAKSLVQQLFSPSASKKTYSLMQHWFWLDNRVDGKIRSDYCDCFAATVISVGTLTPLHYAAMLHEPDICSWLLESGCSVNHMSDLGQPLHLAIIGTEGRFGTYNHIVHPTLSKHPPPPPPPPPTFQEAPLLAIPPPPPPPPSDLEKNPLGYSRVLKLLIEAGADLSTKSGIYEEKACKLAALRGSQKLVPLLQAGVNVDEDTMQFLADICEKSGDRTEQTIEILKAIQAHHLTAEARACFSKLCLMAKFTASNVVPTSDFRTVFSNNRNEHWAALKQAVKHDHVEAARALLELGNIDLEQRFNLYEFNATGVTLLHQAAVQGSFELLQCLLDFGANLHQSDGDGRVPLHFASYDATGTKARLLLQRGSRVDATNSQGWTSYHFATALCNKSMLEAIAEQDPDPQSSLAITALNGCTPLHVFGALVSIQQLKLPQWNRELPEVLESRYMAALDTILNLGADPSAITDDGSTALHHWLAHGFLYVDCIEKLVAKGVNYTAIRNDGKTPLHVLKPSELADTACIERILKFLLPDAAALMADKQGRFPIHDICCSFSSMNVQLFKLLTDRGVSPMLEDRKGNSCFKLTLEMAEQELRHPFPVWSNLLTCASFMAGILQCMEDPDLEVLRKYSGRVFEFACRIERDSFITTLLEKGFDVDMRDTNAPFNSMSGLQKGASYCSSLNFRKMLNRSKFQPPYKEAELLPFTCNASDTGSMTLLLDCGVDPDERISTDHSTALMRASARDKPFHIASLLDRGASLNLVDVNGNNALHFACINNSGDAVRVLLDRRTCNESSHRGRSFKGSDRRCQDGRESLTNIHTGQREDPSVTSTNLDINAKNTFDNTALRIAVNNSYPECVKHLLASGASTWTDVADHSTLLYVAGYNGNMEIVDLLLQSNDSVDQNSKGEGPYLGALRQGHIDIAKKILDFSLEKGKHLLHMRVRSRLNRVAVRNNTDKNRDSQKYTLASGLTVAIETDDVELCDKLITLGVDINLPIPPYHLGCGCGNCTPLIDAFRLQKHNIVNFLIEKGASLQQQDCEYEKARGYTPFHFAVLANCPERILRSLLERLPAPKFPTFAVHPIFMAIASHNNEALRLLIRNYVGQFSPQLSPGDTAIQTMSDIPSKFGISALSTILEVQLAPENSVWVCSLTSGSMHRSTLNTSGTPLHAAAWFRNLEAVNILLKHGANVNSINHQRDTPLHMAARKTELQIFKALVDGGANPNARNSYLQTPSMLIFRSFSEGFIPCLLKAGADFNITDMSGHNCLWYAMESEEPSAFLFLDKSRFSLHTIDEDGRSYAQIAFSKSYRMDTYFLNEDFDLTICTQRKGSILQIVTGDPRILKRVIRRLPSHSLQAMLDSHGVNWNSALYIAATESSPENIAILLDAGAKIDLEGGPHGTPLMGACEAGNLGTVKFLVRRNAEISYVNENGRMVSGLSLAKYHPVVVRWLLVCRYTDQEKICWYENGDEDMRETKPWSGIQTIRISAPRGYGTSLFDNLLTLLWLERSYFGRVYIPQLS